MSHTAPSLLRWYKKPLDTQEIKNIASRYHIDLLSATILMRRGLHADTNIVYILENKPLFMHNPFLLTDMEIAVDRIWQAIDDKHNVMIFGDRDADGICSTSLLGEYLQDHGLKPLIKLPLGADPYGITEEAVTFAKEHDVDLIICVDNGSSAHKAIHLAHEYQIDVIVFDHHDVKDVPLGCLAFVNPKQDDHYPFTDLCASTLVHKVLFALDFYQTEHYNKPLCLLDITVNEQNQNIYVTTMTVINLKKGPKHTFILNTESHEFLQSIQGLSLVVFDQEKDCQILSQFFNADVFAQGLKQNMPQLLAGESQQNLEYWLHKSSIKRFYPTTADTMDILYHFYSLSVLSQKDAYPHFWQGFDLATIGMIADVMPIINENRIVAKLGLQAINAPKRRSLALLLNKNNLLAHPIHSQTISWRLAPMLNASGRLGQADKAVQLFLTTDDAEKARLVEELDNLNNERKRLSQLWWDKVLPSAQQFYQQSKEKAIFIYDKEMPRGMTGLLAGRLSRYFGGAFTIIATQRQPDEIIASMRCEMPRLIPEFFVQAKDLLIDFGGHDCAGGFSIFSHNLPALQNLFHEFVLNMKITSNPTLVHSVDAEIPHQHFNSQLFDLEKRFYPYGDGFNRLIFVTYHVILESMYLVGKSEKHLRLLLRINDQTWVAMLWNAEAFIDKLHPKQNLHILYHISHNGEEKNLEIIDLEIAE